MKNLFKSHTLFALLALAFLALGTSAIAATQDAAVETTPIVAECDTAVEVSVEVSNQELTFPAQPSFLDVETSWICIPGGSCTADWQCGNNGYCKIGSCRCL